MDNLTSGFHSANWKFWNLIYLLVRVSSFENTVFGM